MTTRELLFKIHGDDFLDNVLNLVDRLNEWFEDTNHHGVTPTASMSYTGSYVSVNIGEELVWDTEGGDIAEELTLESCLNYWKGTLRAMQPFLRKK